MVDISSEPQCISLAIADAVADEEGVSPVELTPPLYETVDPTALNDLIRDDNFDGLVNFTYQGHQVKVDGNGYVMIES